MAEERIIPIIEAIVRVYAANAPPPKRLKFLAKEFGEVKLRQLIEAEASYSEEVPVVSGLPEHFVAVVDGHQRLELPVFAGKLTAEQLAVIANSADSKADGVLMVTADQNIALLLPPGADAAAELNALQQGTGMVAAGPAPALRVCPGSHECLMGLTATRDVAHGLLAHIGKQGQKLSWALSGCANSCSQPQLADVGIVSSALVKGEDGERTPRFDLYRLGGAGLGTAQERSLTLDELYSKVSEIG